MNYEEKYKNALGWMQSLYDGLHGKTREEAERYFPELVESEDERIKKELISFLQLPHPQFVGERKQEKWLTWLEKQGCTSLVEEMKRRKELLLHEKENAVSSTDRLSLGGRIAILDELIVFAKEKKGEQMPADKVESKFKVGDWIIFNGLILHIDEIVDGYYRTTSIGGIPNSYDWDIDNLARLWTIKDAKDGDVLSYRDGQWIFIYKEKIDDSSFCYHTLYSTIHQDLTINDAGFTLLCDAIIPATKEQRDLLFQNMHEAGYTFDFEKKELRKIEDEPQLKEGNFYKCIKSYHHLCGNEYWFVEGNVYFCEKDGYLRSSHNNLINVYDCKNWQNYFRPYTGKPTWSEYDEKMVKDIIAAIDTLYYHGMVNWLKSLKDRIQPKQ